MIKRKKFKWGKSSQQRKETVSDYLQLCADRALECSPIDFGIPWMGGKRTDEDQAEIFEAGNSKCDGYKIKSNHQKVDKNDKGRALDVVPYINGGYDYNAHGHFGIIGMLMLEAWQELQDEGLIPKTLHLHWGGFWKPRQSGYLGWDLAHYEIQYKPQIIRL